MALVIMGANIAGIYGAQIFRSDDSPRYRRAFSVACAVLAAGLAFAVMRYVDDVVRRKRRGRDVVEPSASESDATSLEKAGAVVMPSDDQPGPMLIEDGGKPVVSAGLKAIA